MGEKLFFIGGFDQNAGFEKGTVENVREQVFRLFAAKKHGGYICCPSDHFFFGEPDLIRRVRRGGEGMCLLILIPNINTSLHRSFSRMTVSLSAQRSAATPRSGSLSCIENPSTLWTR